MNMHLNRELLQAVAEGKMPPRAFLDLVLDHLFDLCPDCQAEWDAYQVGRRAAPGSSYSTAFAVLERLITEHVPRIKKEERASARDFRDLLRVPPEERAERISHSYRRFRTLSLIERLLDKCRSCLHVNPKDARHFADLALLVAQQVPDSSLARELHALAFGELANATRATGDLVQADLYLTLARQRVLHGGVTDPRVAARLDSLEGSLRKDQRLFGRAKEALQRAFLLYGSVGEQTQVAKVLMKLSAVHFQEGKPWKALAVGNRVLEILRPDDDYVLYLAARRNLADYMVDVGRTEEALAIVDADESGHRMLYQPLFQIRYTWIRGRISSRRGDLADAEMYFRQARDVFVAAGIGYDAAMVSLELALAYLQADRPEKTRILAEEIAPIFQSQDVHREAIAALLLFREAAEQQTLTAEFVRELVAYLEAARTDWSLRFTPHAVSDRGDWRSEKSR